MNAMKKSSGFGSSVRVGLLAMAMTVVGFVQGEVPLPLGYTAIEWIESTGRQLLNTEWKASATLRCELDFAPLMQSGGIMMGTGTGKSGAVDWISYRFFNYSGGYIFDLGTGSAQIRVGLDSSKKLAIDGTRYLLKVGVDDNGYSYAEATNVETENVFDPTRKDASSANPESEDVYVFGGNLGGTFSCEKMRLYGLKMFDVKSGEIERSLVRDFVPCRNEEGVAGVWEKVEGRFYTNCVEGGLRFAGSDDVAARVEYIESTGSQLLNTTWKASATLRCELDFAPLMYGSIMLGTGVARSGVHCDHISYRFCNHTSGYFFDLGKGVDPGTGKGLGQIRVGLDSSKKLAIDGTRYLLKVGVDDNGYSYAEATNVGTGETLAPARKAAAGANPESEDVYVFGGNLSGAVSCERMRLYGLKMYDIKEGETERSLVRDFVPYRFANGTLGVYDLTNDTPDTGKVTGVFAGGIAAYDFEGENGATLVVHEGAVPAALFANRTLIAKASPYEANISAVTSYPALELRKGTLSVQDDAATDYAIAGTMKVAGGTRLVIDLTADGCDCFTAQTLDFSALSEDSPLFVVVRKPDDLTALAAEYVIAKGAGVADGELATLVARCDVQMKFEMRAGKLVMTPISNDPMTAEWKGGATGGVTNAANWICRDALGNIVEGGLPMNKTRVVFPDGCAFDWTKGMAFEHGGIVLPATLGGNCDWTGLDVPIDTTIDLRGHKLYVSELKGTGTITDTTALGEELIQDGGFEGVTIKSGNYGYLVNGGATSARWQSEVPGHTGFAKAGSPFTDTTGNGAISAFVQIDGNLYQTVNVPEDGAYVLTYSYVSRKNQTAHTMEVRIDDKPLVGRTYSAAAWAVNKVVLHLTAGEHKIAFVGVTTDDLTTVLDDVSLRKIPAAGELHVVVPEGRTAEWTSVTIDGALKFVKEGAGTYLASNMNGTGVKTWYLGDTWVREGCYKVHQSRVADGSGLTDYGFYQVQQLGAQGSETTVEKNATFDGGGNYDGFCYTIVLNGGTFGNLGTISPIKTYGVPSRFRLTDDSFVTGLSDTQLGDTDLGGHTLTVTIDPARSLYLRGAVRNGTLVCNGGCFMPCGGDMTDVDLVLNSKMSCADQTVTFRNLTVTYTGDGFGTGDKFFCVSGTYTPVSDPIHRFKLLDGATIDLSKRTTPLDIQPDENGLFFDENAKTIYVSVAGRKLRSSEPLLTWTGKPDVKFKATNDVRCGLIVKENGLYPFTGLSIIIR